jgi:alpha-amylase
VVNLFMDYETFGEHQWEESGIFDFMRALPESVFKNSPYTFSTPSEVAAKAQVVSAALVPNPISWADEERDLTAWLGNEMQYEAFEKLYSLEEKVYASGDDSLVQDFSYLQVSDHLYYMSTKFFSDGEVHSYFNPYDSPYDAFINYMNVLSDFEIRVNAATRARVDDDIARLSKIISEKDAQLEKLEERLATISKKGSTAKQKDTAEKKVTGKGPAAAAKKTAGKGPAAAAKKTAGKGPAATAKKTAAPKKSSTSKKR